MLRKKLGVEAIEAEKTIWSLRGYFKIPSTLIIPEGCKRIGSSAFDGCSGLREVIIPKSVDVIRDGAFENCNKLKKAVIPEGVRRIEEYAFYDCRKLEKVVISKSVEYIGEYAFCWCSEAVVTLRKLKSAFEYISPDAFRGCRYVEEKTGN